MATTKWNGHAHDKAWFTPGNWTAGVPVTQQVTQFVDGHTWSISLAGAQAAQCGALTITGDTLTFRGGELDATAAPVKHGTPTDLTLNSGSTLNIAAGATFASTNGMYSAGTFNIHGTLDASLAYLYGTTNVSGSSAHVLLANIQTMTVGGTMTVFGGANLDAGPNTLRDFYSYVSVGSANGPGVLAVKGKTSTITLAHINVGNGYNGTLSVTSGGTVHAGVVVAGQGGDGFVQVSGEGSTLTTLNAVQIGDVNYLPVASSLTVTDHGSVDGGTYGVDLYYGTLVVDATAHLTGFIISEVGKIEAVSNAASQGIVTVSNDIYLQANNGNQGQYDYTSTVFSQEGVTLDLTGAISGDTTTILNAGSGSIVLANAANQYGSTQIYNAHLEIAAAGAAGTRTIAFTGGGGQAPVLQIDAGIALNNSVTGFAGADAIDVRGFAFAGATETYSAGKLILSSGSSTDTLSVSGSYTTGNFALADDHNGGVLITYVQS